MLRKCSFLTAQLIYQARLRKVRKVFEYLLSDTSPLQIKLSRAMCFECTFEQHLIKKKLNSLHGLCYSVTCLLHVLCVQNEVNQVQQQLQMFSCLFFSPQGFVFFLLSKVRALQHFKKQTYTVRNTAVLSVKHLCLNTKTSHRLISQMSSSIKHSSLLL